MSDVANDASLALERAMSEEERLQFLERCDAINPRWRGAHVADYIVSYFDTDRYLELREPLWEHHPELWETHSHLTSMVVIVVAILNPEVSQYATQTKVFLPLLPSIRDLKSRAERELK